MSVTLAAPYPTIETLSTLPNPDFSDVQSNRAEVTVHRSMDNTKRTTIKTSSAFRLTYSFRMTRMKTLEVIEFVRSYYASQIRLVNHKDEVWIVKLLTNPSEFNAAGRSAAVQGGEYGTVTLTFEGTKQ